jgi:hypothetical protein
MLLKFLEGKLFETISLIMIYTYSVFILFDLTISNMFEIDT